MTRTPRGDASALVVGAGDKVEMRNITATQAIGDKWLVTDGLKDGDRVIVTGLQKFVGAQVKAQEVKSDDKQQASAAGQSEQTKS